MNLYNPSHFSKAPSRNTFTEGLGLQHMTYGGGAYNPVHSHNLTPICLLKLCLALGVLCPVLFNTHECS